MRHLDLFSGIGGFALAATWVWGDKYENVGHSEIEKFPCQVYHRHFPESECLGDITKISWREGQADLITGGFPCQPHSLAGKRKASEDERDLWHECIRALRGVRPRYAVFENVPGLVTSDRGRFFNRVLRDIHESGYDAEWQIVSAQAVGAPHKRERIWIVAYANGGRQSRTRPGTAGHDAAVRGEELADSESRKNLGRERRDLAGTPSGRQSFDAAPEPGSKDVAHTEVQPIGPRPRQSEPLRERGRRSCDGRSEGTSADAEEPRLEGPEPEGDSCAGGCSAEPRSGGWQRHWWSTEPDVGRVAHGVSFRVDRLKALGNAIVPQCAAVILNAIKIHDKQESLARARA